MTDPAPTAESTKQPTNPPPTKRSRLERRADRDKGWATKQLARIGKGDALNQLHEQRYTYTPFEMRLLLDPSEASAAAESRIAGVAQALESARNMLIVVPLILTWSSLALAGAAYQQSIDAHHALTSEPFLQQWQEGFPTLTSIHLYAWTVPLVAHRAHWFTFAGFALLDALLLAVLLILTVLSQVLGVWTFRRGARLFSFIEKYLYDLNMQSLYMIRTPTDDKLPPWLRELQSRLGQLGEVITKMNGALESSLKSYTDAIDSQRNAVADLLEDTQDIHDSVVRLDRLFQTGVEAQRTFQNYIPTIANQFSSLAQDQRQSTAAFSGMTAMLAQSMRSLATLAGQLHDAEAIIRRYQAVLPSEPPPSRPQPSWM